MKYVLWSQQNESEINSRRKTGKYVKLNNTVLKIVGQRKKINVNIIEYFEMNKNKITTYQNLYNVTKTVLSEKCLAVNIYIKKEELSQINNLFLYLKELD